MLRPGIEGVTRPDEYCRQRNLPRTTFEQWVRHLVSPEALSKRAENLRKLRQEKLGSHGGNCRSKKRRRPVRHRFGARTDDGPVALRAFWSMHVEAMNWSGMGHAEYAAALGLSPHASHKCAIVSRIPRWKWTGGRCFIRVPGLN
jgi:hypothetical protein